MPKEIKAKVTALERISEIEDKITISFLIDGESVMAQDLIQVFKDDKEFIIKLDGNSFED